MCLAWNHFSSFQKWFDYILLLNTMQCNIINLHIDMTTHTQLTITCQGLVSAESLLPSSSSLATPHMVTALSPGKTDISYLVVLVAIWLIRITNTWHCTHWSFCWRPFRAVYSPSEWTHVLRPSFWMQDHWAPSCSRLVRHQTHTHLRR